MGVCLPCAPPRADSQHVPAQGGSRGGDGPDCASTMPLIVFSPLPAVFGSVALEGLCVWVWCVRRLQGFKGLPLGKSSTPRLHALDYTPRPCPLTLCWLQFCSGKKLTWECSDCPHVQIGGLATQQLVQKLRIGDLQAQPK